MTDVQMVEKVTPPEKREGEGLFPSTVGSGAMRI
jgi:hypothetical protein